MADRGISRRLFVQGAAAVTAGIAGGAVCTLGAAADPPAKVQRTRSYDPKMEYRRLGKTGIWVSAVCMGGHWKRINTIVKGAVGPGNDDFDKNRYDVLTRCIERGINLVDACCAAEIIAYSKALKGRRGKMYMCFSWYEKESRFPDWRTAKALLEGLEYGMKQADLDVVDIWRISALMDGKHTKGEVEEMVKALEVARKQGKVRWTGLSSHNREWLKMMIETYPDVMQVVLTPYTADTMELPKDSLFEAVRNRDVGLLGIKPFASNSLFKGDSSPHSPTRDQDDKLARLAIRRILANPAMTAPIPGLISEHQVDNMVAAIREHRELDAGERAELKAGTRAMWARLPQEYQWLHEWRQV